MHKFLNLLSILSIVGALGVSSGIAQEDEAQYIDEEYGTCADCHDQIQTAHRFSENGVDDPIDCQHCHGPASLHVDEGGESALILRFDANRCIACHAKDAHVAQFDQSAHAAQGMTCLECHVIHPEELDSEIADQLLLDTIPMLCLECHEEPHPGHHPVPSPESCLACHDPHANVKHEGESLTQKCLVCHKTNPHVGEYVWSGHAKGHLSCVECHGIHNEQFDQPKKQCLTCHPVREIELSHPQRHPGNLSCIECHNPHERQPHAFEDRYSPRCIVCHDDKGEPFAFSHEAGREQGCLECHETHKSIHPRLLKSTPRFLCISCHSDAHLGDSARRVRDCLDCHPSFHGSHEESRFIR